MSYVEQQQSDADDSVVTSARPLDGIQAGFDPEKTWTGDEEVSELDGLRRRNAFLERHVEDLRAQLLGERERKTRAAAAELRAVEAERRAMACVNVILRGLSAVSDDDLLAEVQRRGFARPVPAAAVPVARDDGGNDAAKDAS
jgi:hypothetical protein